MLKKVSEKSITLTAPPIQNFVDELLNPIENLWAIMKRRLQNYDTSSVPKIIEALKHLWINQSLVDD